MKFIFITLVFLIGFSGGWFLKDSLVTKGSVSPSENTISDIIDKPLEKYQIENLSNANIQVGEIKVKKTLNETEKFASYLFEFEFNPNLDGKTKKTTTGQINIPNVEGYDPGHRFPIVLMFRGYVDQSVYKTGDGTRNASNYFAENGFITVAPDFLGYGGSDKESGNIFETRFQTYVTAISLLKTLESLNSHPELVMGSNEIHTLLTSHSPQLFLWGHSNGGQIAITTLEITGGEHPTTLWAPVTKMFPYSVLYYTDQSEDRGKLIRRELAKFEELYDVEKYSLTNYLDRIKSPIVLHQGINDEAVPVVWSQDFSVTLKNMGKDITLYTYPDTDHNMRPSWNEVVQRDLEFFNTHI